MDYIFFAFSALCLGFSIILAFLLAARRDRQPNAVHLILAFAAALAFYFLDVSVFSKQLTSYYLANLLPQASLALFLIFYLGRRNRD